MYEKLRCERPFRCGSEVCVLLGIFWRMHNSIWLRSDHSGLLCGCVFRGGAPYFGLCKRCLTRCRIFAKIPRTADHKSDGPFLCQIGHMCNRIVRQVIPKNFFYFWIEQVTGVFPGFRGENGAVSTQPSHLPSHGGS